MKVEVIAASWITLDALKSTGYSRHMADLEIEDWSDPAGDPVTMPMESEHDIDELHEFAGRSCYLSYDRPNPATAENKDYLANIINSKHESVLAHGHVTFLISGITRACAHEMIRHRFLAFSEVSQRYVDPRKILDFVYEPGDYAGYEDELGEYDRQFDWLRGKNDWPLKAARGKARLSLTLGFPTVQVVSGNIRAWRDFVKQRNTEYADREIREVAQLILAQLRELCPNSVQDL